MLADIVARPLMKLSLPSFLLAAAPCGRTLRAQGFEQLRQDFGAMIQTVRMP